MNITQAKISIIDGTFAAHYDIRGMSSIKTEIVIHANVSTVWNILTQFDQYKTWNSLVHINGQPGMGNVLENTMFLEKDGKPQIFKPQITKWTEEQIFAWRGSLIAPFIFSGEHYFELRPIDKGQVRLIHGENFSGFLSGLIMRMIGAKTKLGFERMNSELKIVAESKS